VAACVLAGLVGCAGAIRVIDSPDSKSELSLLWVEPQDIERRDLYFGAGGQTLRPDAGPFKFVEEDTTGASPGYDVLDQQGREWSVKLGIEAQPEVVVSRVLWAIGYHQDPLYYVETWRFDDERGVQPSGRFRLESEEREVVGEWSWRQNPFVGSRALAGLIITNVLLNNWDWKTSNNKIYGTEGPNDSPRAERYLVRDLGSALGRTTYPAWLQWSRLRGVLQGTKNDLEGFESQGFVKDVDGDRVSFDYVGIHGDLLDSVTTGDVVWTSRLLSRLSERQWQDAFRAAGYTPDVSSRYVRHIQKKLAEGLALGALPEPGLPE
jgi:hypothetical protein